MHRTKNFENGFEIRNLHHLVTKKVPHNISQILRVTQIQRIRSNQKFNFFKNFKNFKNLLMGGHDEKLKNFGKSKKKIGDLYELDNFKQKISKLKWQMSFFDRF